MKIILYKGYHHDEAFSLFKQCYQNNDLILFLPPTLKDHSFISLLPDGEIDFRGELWDDPPLSHSPTTEIDYPEQPFCGVFTS
ncbi:MAG: hypothetical protein AAF203_03225, partial [Pseudomonadota bacterium]